MYALKDAQKTMINKPFPIRAEWDDLAQVWVATSDDVPGLVAEDESLEKSISKIKIMIPDLLSANGQMIEDEMPFEILTHRFEIARPAA